MIRAVIPTMIAIVVKGNRGPASALEATSVPVPEVKRGEILIGVEAAGVNRLDLSQRRGSYPPPPGAPATLGLEVAGRVVVADGRWKVGDRVCALLAGGGYAEYAVVDARHALPIPNGLTFEEAASLPEALFTVFANMIELGKLAKAETLLVHGANSGIGVMAIQMAKAIGAKVIATARGAEKVRAALALGADVVIDTTIEDFGEVASRMGGVDVVLDMVGGDYAARNLDALNTNGRIVFIASLGGKELILPIPQIMRKGALITGSTLRPRGADEKARLAAEIERVIWPLLLSGEIKPQVDRVFPLADAAAAHAYLESGAHVGKIILAAK